MARQIPTIDKKFDTLVYQKVIEVMREILNDPDFGLDLTSDFVRRLRSSIQSKKAGRTIALDEVLKKI